MRVVQGGSLRTKITQQFWRLIHQPAVLQRLLVKKRAWIWRGQRDLDRMRVDLSGKADRLFDGFLCLAWKAENECAVDSDAELVAILGEPPGYIYSHALLDIMQDLLIAGLVSNQEKPQPIVFHDLQS